MSKYWQILGQEKREDTSSAFGKSRFSVLYRNVSIAKILDSGGREVFIKGLNTIPDEFRVGAYFQFVGANFDVALLNQTIFLNVEVDETKKIDERVPFVVKNTDGGISSFIDTKFVRARHASSLLSLRGQKDLAAYIMFEDNDNIGAFSNPSVKWYLKVEGQPLLEEHGLPFTTPLSIVLKGEVLEPIDIDDQSSITLEFQNSQSLYGRYEGQIYENPFISDIEEARRVGLIVLNQAHRLGVVEVTTAFQEKLLSRGIGSQMEIENLDGQLLPGVFDEMVMSFDSSGRFDTRVGLRVNTLPLIPATIPLQNLNNPFGQGRDLGCDPSLVQFNGSLEMQLIASGNLSAGAAFDGTASMALTLPPPVLEGSQGALLEGVASIGLATSGSITADLFILISDVNAANSTLNPIWNEPTVNTAGISNPTTAPTLVETVGGNEIPAGTYRYKIAFQTASGITLPGPESQITVTNPAGGNIDLSNVEIGPAGTTSRVIYRTYTNGAVFHRVVDIGGNVITSITNVSSNVSVARGKYDAVDFKRTLNSYAPVGGAIISSVPSFYLDDSIWGLEINNPQTHGFVALESLRTFNVAGWFPKTGGSPTYFGPGGGVDVYGFAVVANSTRLFVLGMDDTSQTILWSFDPVTFTLQSTIVVEDGTIGSGPGALALDRVGNVLYVIHNDTLITSYDAVNLADLGTVDGVGQFSIGGPGDTTAEFYNGHLYFQSIVPNEPLVKVLPTTGARVAVIGATELGGFTPSGVTISAEAGELYAGTEKVGQNEPFGLLVFVYDINTLNLLRTLELGGAEPAFGQSIDMRVTR